MELLTLNGNFQPTGLVENYGSLIWTERYSTNGDFELQTADVQATLNLLPRESFVSLRDSTVPMVVETHKIVKDKNAGPVLVVTGRSFETVLERRASVKGQFPLTATYGGWKIPALKPSDAAYLAMRVVLGDIARSKNGTQVLPATALADMVSALDAIPEIDLTLPADFEVFNDPGAFVANQFYNTGARVTSGGALWEALQPHYATDPVPSIANPTWWKLITNQVSFDIPIQDLYKTVTDLITVNRHGIKAVRPLSPSGTKAGIEIYNGANLTGVGDNSSPMNIYTFDARFDQFDSSTYLLSAQGSTNVDYSMGSGGGEIVNKTASPEASGLARRVLATNSTDAGTPDARRSRALVELYKNNATALFDGEIAQQVASDYNKAYFLGDILGLFGEYGLKTYVRVSEYIRSQDNSGESAFPTLEVVDIFA